MGKRLSTVEQHPQRARIDSMLDDGVTYKDVSTKFGLSLPAVGRYALSRKSTLAKVAEDEPNVTSVALRLIEAADHARDIRRIARVAGTPVQQSRAIRDETDVVMKLVDYFGLDETDLEEAINQILLLAPVLIAHVKSDEKAGDLADRMRSTDGLEDLGRILQRQRDENR